MTTQYGKNDKPKKDHNGDRVIYEFIPLKVALRIRDVVKYTVKFDA